MNNFHDMDKLIDRILLFIFVCAVLLFFFSSCGQKTTYYIYLEHTPDEPLYTTSSLEDAEDYYKQYKPFHSDMYIVSNND